MPRNYYATLRVSQYAGPDEIKKAYKQCALEFHPDKNPTDQESFKLISQAYKVLGDPLARSVYDRVRSDDIIRDMTCFQDVLLGLPVEYQNEYLEGYVNYTLDRSTI